MPPATRTRTLDPEEANRDECEILTAGREINLLPQVQLALLIAKLSAEIHKKSCPGFRELGIYKLRLLALQVKPAGTCNSASHERIHNYTRNLGQSFLYIPVKSGRLCANLMKKPMMS